MPDEAYDMAIGCFGRVEPQYPDADLVEAFAVREELPNLTPLAANDPARPAYARAASAAEGFAKWSLTRPEPDARTAMMLYVAANSEFSLGRWSQARAAVEMLLARYPDYSRPRLPGHPELDRPARLGLLHLDLYLRARTIDPATASPLEALRNIVGLANQTFDSDAQWRSQVQRAGHHETVQLREELEDRNLTSDQLRANGLPDEVRTVLALHDQLLPAVIKRNGPKATRDYLRTLSVSGGRFASYAQAKLITLDRDILAAYFAQAQTEWNSKHWAVARAALQTIIDEYADSEAAMTAKAELRKLILAQYTDEAQIYLANHDYDNAKAAYKQLIAELPDGDEAAWADGELRKIVPAAVVYYKGQGDKVFHPEAKGQFGMPQTKAAEFYEKMYKEDPDGPQADVALYYWSQALGTEGKIDEAIEKLDIILKHFPDGKEVPYALYFKGFIYGSAKSKQYDLAIKIMQQVADKYPQSDVAPEALWYAAFFSGFGKGNYLQGVPYLEELRARYPNSRRSFWAQGLIDKFKKGMKS